MIRFPAAEIGVEAMRRLRACAGVDIQRGLSDSEFDRITARYGFEFAQDHQAFLRGGVPTGSGWPDWRSPDQRSVRDQLSWPVEGLLFEVEHKGWWHPWWGERPVDLLDAIAVAGAALTRAPQMVPLRGNRYLPAGEHAGHPVLAMFRSDVAVAGADLADWVAQEFGDASTPDKSTAVSVEFWSTLL